MTISLQAIDPSQHARFLYEARRQPDIARFMYQQEDFSWKSHLAWLNEIAKDTTRIDWVVTLDKQPVGRAYLTQKDDENASCAFGMFIASTKARLLGAGAAAEYLSLNYAFDVWQLDKVFCEVFLVNEAPLRMHSRMGFVEERVIKDHASFEGKSMDVVVLCLTSEAWQGRRSSIAHLLEKILPKEGSFE